MPAKKEIDPNEVRKLAMIGATLEEIARYLGCSHDTIERRFRKQVAEGRADGCVAAKGRVYKKGVINGELPVSNCIWSTSAAGRFARTSPWSST